MRTYVCKVIGDLDQWHRAWWASREEHLSSSNYIGLDFYFNNLGQICIPTSGLSACGVACFYARQRSYSAYMTWQFRLSVRLSVTQVDQSKTVEARITLFSLYSSPIPLVFRG